MDIGRNAFGQRVSETEGSRSALPGVEEPGLLLKAPDLEALWLCCLAAVEFPEEHLGGGLDGFLRKIGMPLSASKGASFYLASAFFRLAPLFGSAAGERLSDLSRRCPGTDFEPILFAFSVAKAAAPLCSAVRFVGFPFIPVEVSLACGRPVHSDHDPRFDLPPSAVPPLPAPVSGLPILRVYATDSKRRDDDGFSVCAAKRGADAGADGLVPMPLAPSLSARLGSRMAGLPWTPSALTDILPSRGADAAYRPVSSLPASASMSPALSAAFSVAKARIRPDEAASWDASAETSMGLPHGSLPGFLSAEQVDAHIFGKRSLEAGNGFIVADETGVGKGRTLASLVRATILGGGRVLFITEKKSLFSDFWRDLSAVTPDPSSLPEPLMLHPLGKIFDGDGKLRFKALPPKKMAEMLSRDPSALPPLAFTCYSQFNRQSKDNKKVDFARGFLSAGKSLLVLDESHNASGDSSTRQNVLALIGEASGVLFSSATFAKNGGALSLYSKALPMTPREISLLEDCFVREPPSAFGEAISCSLTAAGLLLRREHSFEGVPVSSVLDPKEGLLAGLRADASPSPVP